MQTLNIKNFRAFGRDQQTCRLAPLTLLVGENSTGKTSFMALIRALWDVAYADSVPNFQASPYDLGSWGSIIHNRGDPGSEAGYFEASFTVQNGNHESTEEHDDIDANITFSVRFDARDGAPYPVWRRFANGETWIEAHQNLRDGQLIIRYATSNTTHPDSIEIEFAGDEWNLLPVRMLPSFLETFHEADSASIDALRALMRNFRSTGYREYDGERQPYASAPIRSRPQRTYNQGVPMRDSEGERTATYLARMSVKGGNEWEALNRRFLDFGSESGLFDEIEIRSLGDSEGDPFQIRVRLGATNDQAPFRNLTDVGYGVSQVLPILTELLRTDAPRMFLLQQPEIHLHPSAQAALGTLFCTLATSGKQLIVETHSDHLIDRVRMSVRDGANGLKPEDVSILYFERKGFDVKIHSISIDWNGNIIGAPEDYRRFFMEEVERSIGLKALGKES